jgi:hypothetical protein
MVVDCSQFAIQWPFSGQSSVIQRQFRHSAAMRHREDTQTTPRRHRAPIDACQMSQSPET